MEMKRKHSTSAAHTGASSRQDPSQLEKKAKSSIGDVPEGEMELDEMVIQDFLLRDCQASSKKLVEQANTRVAELRQELEEGKKVLIDALEAEKENLDKDAKSIPRAFTISVRCITGPYRGRKFSMAIDADVLLAESSGLLAG
ncbi:hypothetical protein P3T76_002753 [Phytophthora citrophthora]|uniref:Uncharacterized protein n=1 Tax=Phytophthora citrophthora TaxID=4793 RepID=A0AAD9GW82_9STRA|nr:hypothetical protein P3T76_002753 [Phytophthora citrophthora]